MLQTTQSWRHMSRCSARRRGRGTMGGSSVDTKSFPSVDCGTFLQLAALTESQKQQSTRPVYPHTWRQYNTLSSGRACHPHACCACPSAAPGGADGGSRHACRKTPPVSHPCNSAAVAALPHACSDCACLLVLPDKQRL